MRAFLGLTINKLMNPSGYSRCGTNLAFGCIDGELWPELINPACLSAEDNDHGVPQLVAENMSAAQKRNPFTRDPPPHTHTLGQVFSRSIVAKPSSRVFFMTDIH